jgi:hypothetical protein
VTGRAGGRRRKCYCGHVSGIGIGIGIALAWQIFSSFFVLWDLPLRHVPYLIVSYRTVPYRTVPYRIESKNEKEKSCSACKTRSPPFIIFHPIFFFSYPPNHPLTHSLCFPHSLSLYSQKQIQTNSNKQKKQYRKNVFLLLYDILLNPVWNHII